MSKKKQVRTSGEEIATVSGPNNGWWIYSRGDFATDIPDFLTRKQAMRAGNLEFEKFQNGEQELAKLRASTRLPPKRLAGFVNMKTGEKRDAFPDFITLPADAYDELLHLVRWVEATPACIDLPDCAWDSINDAITDFVQVDEAQWPDVYTDSVQIETVDTTQRNITPGTLVALLLHEDSDDSDEHHCVLVRGAE